MQNLAKKCIQVISLSVNRFLQIPNFSITLLPTWLFRKIVVVLFKLFKARPHLR